MNQKLEKFKEELKTKKIAIIGAGVSNLPLLNYLNNLGCNLTLFDQKELEDMKAETQQIIKKNKVKFYGGKNYLENLVGFDIIFRSPSFLPTNTYLRKEEKRGAIVTTEVEQVIRLTPSKVIGITGSKGKTTTTTIVNYVLTNLGYHTYLGGNIGIPLFNQLDNMTENDIVILELSSFQLMEMKVSPSISVVTNISPDHLDIHKNYEEYIAAKKNIFKNQTKNDIVVLNQDDEIVKEFSKDICSKIRYFGTKNTENNYYLDNEFIKYQDKEIIDTRKLLLKGKHNYLNICAALNAISDFIIKDQDKLENILEKLNGVSHRLEFVREIKGVKWYNDSASTTPDKTLAGIYAFDSDIVLIAGGYDKNISYEPLAAPILNKVSKLILFGATKEKIYDAVRTLQKKTNQDVQIYMMDTLEEVVSIAYQISSPGEIVLFSPASASFDMFQNAYQRGDLFKELVSQL